jgi:hypothetical protein
MLRPLLLVSVVLAAAPTAAVTATPARSARQAVIPACEQILNRAAQEIVMDEPRTGVAHREVRGHTRVCVYVGGSTTEVRHSVEVEVGPYVDFRSHLAWLDRTRVCPAVKSACGKLTSAAKLTPESRSFLAVGRALSQIASARAIDSPEYDHNPAFAVLPSAALAPLDALAMVVVYVPRTHTVIQVACTHSDTRTPDLHCAAKAAGFAYD